MDSWPEPSPDDPITAAEVEQEMRRQDVAAEARTLSALSRTIGAFLTAIGVLGVVGGAIIAVVKPSEDSPFSDGSHVVFGVVVMVGSILQIGLVLIFTKTAGVIARYTMFRVGGSSDESE